MMNKKNDTENTEESVVVDERLATAISASDAYENLERGYVDWDSVPAYAINEYDPRIEGSIFGRMRDTLQPSGVVFVKNSVRPKYDHVIEFYLEKRETTNGYTTYGKRA